MFHVKQYRSLFATFIDVGFIGAALHVDGDIATRLFTVRTRLQPLLANHIMNDLALERIHRFQINGLTGVMHFINGIKCNVTKTLTLALQEPVNINNQMRAFAGLLLNSKPGKLLQSIDHFTIATNEMLDIRIVISDDLHHRTTVANTHLDIAFVIGDVQ